jgi:hypothetical protein
MKFFDKGQRLFCCEFPLKTDYVVAPMIGMKVRITKVSYIWLKKEKNRKNDYFFGYDLLVPLPIDNAIVFRSSLYKTKSNEMNLLCLIYFLRIP